MTSACGVVEEVNADESALYEGRVDRKVRAAIKGQTAITVEFVNGANRAFVEDIEKPLIYMEDILICMLHRQMKMFLQ